MKVLYADQRLNLCHHKEQNLVVVENGTFHITERASRDHGNISCRYIPLNRGSNDFRVREMETISITHGDLIPIDLYNKRYANIHSTINKEKTKVHPLLTNTMGFKFLILSLYSVSRMTMKRLFPKTCNYFKDTLGGAILEGHNVVGSATVANLLPFLYANTLQK